MFIEGALYPVEDPEYWADKYDLEIKECPCMGCKRPLLVNVPWATKEYRGFKAAQCECGETRVPFVFTFPIH